MVNRFGRSRASRARLTFDDDRDGLSNERERQLGTDPRNPDTDGDGVRDGIDPDPRMRLRVEAAVGVGRRYCRATARPARRAVPRAVRPPGFEGLENVIQEGRSLISHSAYPSAPVGTYCLYRKRRAESDAAYQLVGRDPGAEAGVIRDNQRPFKSEDYIYRTDAVTAAGTVAGSNTVAARGPGASRTSMAGRRSTRAARRAERVGPDRLAQGRRRRRRRSRSARRGGRRLSPPASAGGRSRGRVGDPCAHAADSLRSRQLRQREPHDLRRAPGHRPRRVSVADVTDTTTRPFINVELRARQDGDLHLVVTDTNGSVTYSDPSAPGTPFDLRTFGVIDNTYLIVRPQPGGMYRVSFRTNMNPGNAEIVAGPDAHPGRDDECLAVVAGRGQQRGVGRARSAF